MSLLTITKAQDVAILIPDASHERKAEALELSTEVTAVENDTQRALAVNALSTLKRLRIDAEDSRKAIKKPIDAIADKIQEIAKSFSREIIDEESRLNRLVSDYETKLRLEREAKERAAREQAFRLEQERAKALQDARNAETEADRQALIAKAAEAKQAQQAELVKVVESAAPAKIEGFSAKARWVGTCVDPTALYKARPDLCDIVPSQKRINEAVNSGLRDCAGLVIQQETKVRVA